MSSTSRTFVYIFTVGFIMFIIGSGCSFLANDRIKEVNIIEAQNMLPFQICLPVYIPEGIEMSDLVEYDDDFGSEAEVSISIFYYLPDNRKPVIAVKEWNAPGNVGRMNLRSEVVQRSALRDLLNWLTNTHEINENESQVSANYENYNHNGIDYLLVEIQQPEALQAALVRWEIEPVGYDIFSLLSGEESKRIASSVTNCISIPIATP